MAANEKKTDGLILVCPACYTMNLVTTPENGSVYPPSGTVYICAACGNGRMEFPSDTAIDPLGGEGLEDIIQKKIDEHDGNQDPVVTIEEIKQLIDEKMKGAT